MDKTFIEMRSINKLEDILTRTERIEPHIASCDKVPSWDGELIVYKSKAINKSNILGNIRVQVKGHICDNTDDVSIKYTVHRSDLENYQKDGGCIFLVVQMKNMDEFSIYYYSFLPYDLKLILDKLSDEQKTKNIEFKRYPKEDLELQMKVFRSFVHNREKQIGTVQASFSLEEMDEEKAKLVDGFNFTLFQNGENLKDMFQSAFKLPTYVYANVMQGDISVPVQKMLVEQIITGDFPCSVCLDGKCYYDKVRIKLIEGDEQLLIGKSFSCSAKSKKMSFDLRGSLSDRIRDLNFLLAICNSTTKVLTAGDYFQAEFASDEFLPNYEENKNNLMYMGMVQAAFETLGVKDDLACDDLTAHDEWMIEVIMKSVIWGNLMVSEKELPRILKIRMANITIPVYIKNENENAYKLTSLFNERNITTPANNGELISVHLVMKKDDLLEISNLDYELIAKEIMQQNFTVTIDSAVNMFLLEGIKAFDENRNDELYNMLVSISNWQVLNSGSAINVLNNYQLIKRKRKLIIHEIEKLSSIKMNSTDLQIKLGVAILLGSKVEFEAYWEQLKDEDKKVFKEYPIYHLTETL